MTAWWVYALIVVCSLVALAVIVWALRKYWWGGAVVMPSPFVDGYRTIPSALATPDRRQRRAGMSVAWADGIVPTDDDPSTRERANAIDLNDPTGVARMVLSSASEADQLKYCRPLFGLAGLEGEFERHLRDQGPELTVELCKAMAERSM